MTIAGIGVDVVDIPTFDQQLELAGTRFRSNFTAAERDLRPDGADGSHHLAARWAAKEAFIKAWSASNAGAPPSLDSVDLREIEVVRDAWGRPLLRLHGEVRRAVAEALDPCTVHLSLSHDVGTAVAMVVIDR